MSPAPSSRWCCHVTRNEKRIHFGVARDTRSVYTSLVPLELPRLKPAGARLVNRAKRDGSLYVTRGSRDHDLAKQLTEAGWLVRVPTRALAQYRLSPEAVAA